MSRVTPYDRHLAYREDLLEVGPRFFMRTRLMRRMLQGQRGRILDVGCGDGFFLAQLARMGFQCAGLDASEAMIDRARMRLAGQAELFCGLLQDYAPDQPFDAVVCGEVLEHIEDDVGTLREIARVLRPGGVLVVSVPIDMRLWNEADAYAGHVRRYSKGEILNKLRQAGLAPASYVVWGFPITRALHFRIRREQCNLMESAARPGSRKLLRGLLAWVRYVFLLDNLFNWTERGVGIVVKAVRNAGSLGCRSTNA